MNLMSTEVNRAFAKLERRTERIVAILRLLALAVLALVFWPLGLLESRHAAAVPLGGFVMITIAGLVTARRGLFAPWIPWLLSSLDVILLSHCLVMLAMATGLPLPLVLDTPVASLIFVFLAIAAARHRPFLILYTGGLFVGLWLTLLLAAPLVGLGSWTSATSTATLGRIPIVALVTFALFVTVRRASRTLTISLVEARLRANLSRYFSPRVVDEIANATGTMQSFRPQKAAILFADLRGFTSLAEKMSADKVADFLNDYRRRISEPILENHGTIDKFIGDGVMAIFGAPEPHPDDARNAVLGGLAVVSAIEQWNAERRGEGRPPLRIGVGIHYGDVIAGPLGDERRLEYTAIGDTVNTAARIERLTADLDESLLISADVLASAAGFEPDVDWVPLSSFLLRGRSQPVQIYRPDWSSSSVSPAGSVVAATPTAPSTAAGSSAISG